MPIPFPVDLMLKLRIIFIAHLKYSLNIKVLIQYPEVRMGRRVPYRLSVLLFHCLRVFEKCYKCMNSLGSQKDPKLFVNTRPEITV